ncbi:MAG: serine acetyltransferase [Sorangiineae bacterium]|nr:serine acetyltransferase [Polyangiaceae bacterium]MEB2323566.1 serine acetyltransferase [Sorangiineae bacterium]
MNLSAERTKSLELAIDEVVKSYDGARDIDNLESAALPNKRAVIEAFCHLRAAIYIGFYSQRALNREVLRYALSEQLYPAYELLTEQIRRAVTYEEKMGHGPARRPTWSDAVVLRLVHALPELRETLNDDLLMTYRSDPAAKSLEEIVFSYPTLQAITAHRIAHLLHDEGVPMIPRIIAEYAHGLTGIDIHPGARIGRSFFIDHGTGVVIGETSEIGDRVRVYQGVTLGALSLPNVADSDRHKRYKRHPTIGDDVTIYAGATILGGDTVIGAGSIIGGNVWLVKSVPPKSKLFGRARE